MFSEPQLLVDCCPGCAGSPFQSKYTFFPPALSVGGTTTLRVTSELPLGPPLMVSSFQQMRCSGRSSAATNQPASRLPPSLPLHWLQSECLKTDWDVSSPVLGPCAEWINSQFWWQKVEKTISLDGKLGLCCWAETSWDLDSDVHHVALVF